jgi:hypothetical protein
MNRANTNLILVTLLAVMAVFVLYLSGASSPTPEPPPLAKQQDEVADLEKQIAFLEQRVQLLYERQAEPPRYKELP